MLALLGADDRGLEFELWSVLCG